MTGLLAFLAFIGGLFLVAVFVLCALELFMGFVDVIAKRHRRRRWPS